MIIGSVLEFSSRVQCRSRTPLEVLESLIAEQRIDTDQYKASFAGGAGGQSPQQADPAKQIGKTRVGTQFVITRIGAEELHLKVALGIGSLQ